MFKPKSRPDTRRPQAKPRKAIKLPPSWVPANQRRVQLLRKRRARSGLSLAEEAELDQLQELSRRYLDAVAPISFEVIEDLRQGVEEAERRGGKSGTKAG
jgi:hypothetical protein